MQQAHYDSTIFREFVHLTDAQWTLLKYIAPIKDKTNSASNHRAIRNRFLNQSKLKLFNHVTEKEGWTYWFSTDENAHVCLHRVFSINLFQRRENLLLLSVTQIFLRDILVVIAVFDAFLSFFSQGREAKCRSFWIKISIVDMPMRIQQLTVFLQITWKERWE